MKGLGCLGCLAVFIFGIVIFVYAALRDIYNAAFGKSSGRNDGQRQRMAGHSGGPTVTSDGQYERPNRRSGDNRIFPDSVGEYVDYEDVH